MSREGYAGVSPRHHKTAPVSRASAEHELGRVKREMVQELLDTMRRKNVTRASLARRIGTSRSAVTRLLNGEESSLTLRLLGKIAVALGVQVCLQLEESAPRRRGEKTPPTIKR